MTRGNASTVVLILTAALTRIGTAEELPMSRAEQVLLQRQEWNYSEMSVKLFSEVIARQFRIPVFLDIAALQDEGVDLETPIQGTGGTMTFHKCLEVNLRPLLLTHLVDEGVLHITTQAEAGEILSVKIYPILDLVRYDDFADDYSSLMTVIQEATSGQWEQVDGVGGTMTPLASTGSLVINQTWKVHREIDGILQAARKARRLQQMPSFAAEPAGPTSVLLGRRVIFGEELLADTAPETSTMPVVRATTKPANWRVPRIDRPTSRKR